MVPTSSTRTQVRWIMDHGDAHLRQRLRQIMDSQLYKCPQAQQLLHQRLLDLHAARPALDDEQIYNELRSYYHDTLLPSPECRMLHSGNVEGRAQSRVRDLTDILGRERIAAGSLLDLGCSEGSITAAIGAALNLPQRRIHGCDVRAPASTSGFTFQIVVDGERLPYEDGQFPCVLALMSLHHVRNVERTLLEVFRVLRPGGVLIIREHDLHMPDLAPVIDVMHGLHVRTWSKPPEAEQFCETYVATYRTRHEWKKIITAAGFEQSKHSADVLPQPWDFGDVRSRTTFIRNPFCYYYGVYRKQRA